MPSVVLKDLTRAYGSIRAVDGVNLEIRDGEFLSLLGPSGCGKTTTLRMLAGFVDPTAGTIEVDGRLLSAPTGSVPPEKRNMSMIFQSYAIWPNMTVSENVAFGLKIRKLPAADIRRQVGDVLGIVQLGALADRYPAELSGGQQQRVALARAIVIKPSVLLLDEPLSNLDANLREEMRSEIRRLHDAIKVTTVYVTHDQAEAMATSDRIAVMNQGRIEQVDAPHVLYTRPRTRFVAAFIGRTNFLDGTRAGMNITFDGFSVPAARIPELPASAGSGDGKIEFSIRPQSLRLVRAGATLPEGFVTVAGTITQRSFLGEHWDYTFAPQQAATRLKVSMPPSVVFEIDDHATLVVDPTLLVPIL